MMVNYPLKFGAFMMNTRINDDKYSKLRKHEKRILENTMMKTRNYDNTRIEITQVP